MNNRIQYFHVRRPHVSILREGLALERIGATGGLTVAYRATPGDLDPAASVYEVAIARCRVDEHYSKKIGREQAANLLLTGKGTLLAATESTFVAELAKLIHSTAARKNIRAGVRNGGLEKLRGGA